MKVTRDCNKKVETYKNYKNKLKTINIFTTIKAIDSE